MPLSPGKAIIDALVGVAGLAARVTPLRRTIVAVYLWLRPRNRVNERSPFDRALGIDTTGFLPRFLLSSGHAADAHANPYLGCVPGTMRRVFARIPQPERWAFIDLGCGKGRALAVASELPFRSLIGLELSPDLVRVARANAGIIGRRHPDRTPIEVLQGDASQPAIAGPTVLMLFHSFGPALVARLLDVIEAAARAGTPVLLVYLNPVHGHLADARPGLSRWFAETLVHDAEERDYALGDRETVVVWQGGQPLLPPVGGCDRAIVVRVEGWQAELQ